MHPRPTVRYGDLEPLLISRKMSESALGSDRSTWGIDARKTDFFANLLEDLGVDPVALHR